MQEKIKTPEKLRYNIALKLAEHSPLIRVRIKKRVMKSCNVSESTISRWIHLKNADGADIPATALQMFALCLNTTAEELFND